ncbi:uncharacterized protein LOC125202292 [Salvia hispanica]|uniref:uncharacterized protein LOC125202292 n=1 Tax=Salvia hispanica TaxID=49212 RepID=UPI002009B16F|nr:uncharacterized protein LOC125202292 [Salvia hispanica]
MYPKVKVRQEIEEADHYDYGITSLRSLKAFEWLSFDHYSSDDSPVSVVRIPGSDFPKSPTPGFKASKETNKAPIGGSNKTKRATSAPRRLCCAVLSSPDRVISRSKTQTRRELLSPLKSHNSCLDRHTRCKISTKSGDAEATPPHAHNKHLTESKKHALVRGRPRPADEKQQKKKGM